MSYNKPGFIHWHPSCAHLFNSAETDELSLTSRPPEDKISCLKTFKMKLSAMNQLWDISLFLEKDKISRSQLIKTQTPESFVLFKNDKGLKLQSWLCSSWRFLRYDGPGGQEPVWGCWVSRSTGPRRRSHSQHFAPPSLKKKKKTTSEGLFYGNMSSNVIRETGYWPSQRRASPKNTNA